MKKRIIGMICLVVMLTSIAAVGVSAACNSNGYGDYSIGVEDAWWFWETDKAYATLDKCGCSPVNNELMVWIQIQYNENGQYGWTPTESSYYYSHGEDVDSVSKTISHDDITYVHARYFATCGNDPQFSFEREYDN